MKFGLIGTSISHSLSPLLFKAAYPSSIDTYSLIDTDDFEQAFETFVVNDLSAANITTPFKEIALKFVHYRDGLCNTIQATNLIKVNNGILTAYNTDYFGVKESLKKINLSEITTLIVGCGGAGRAAALAARDLGHNTIIANRDSAKSEKYASKIGVKTVQLDDIETIFHKCQVVINTISTHLEIFEHLDFNNKIIFEANYSSPQLLTISEKYSSNYISGKFWLLNQAIPSFVIFTNREPDANAMQLIIDNY